MHGSGFKNPAANTIDQAGLFGDRDKSSRRYHLIANLPAQQRFRPHHLAVGHVKLRLIMQLEIHGLHRSAQLHLKRHGFLNLGFHIRLKYPVSVAAFMFGLIHGHIRITNQFTGILTHLGIINDSNTGPHIQLLPENLERLRQGLNQLLGHPHRRLLRILTVNDHRKFVTTQPAQNIGITNTLSDSYCHFLQKFIAGIVPQRVVNLFEAIQIHKQQRKTLPAVITVGYGVIQRRAKQVAVTQLR